MKDTTDVLLLMLTHFIQDRLGWETYLRIENILEDSASHFVLAAISGLLVFSLIWTICYAAFGLRWMVSRSGVFMTSDQSRFTIFLALAFGLLAVWLSHVGLDYFVAWYNTPLGPPLLLIR